MTPMTPMMPMKWLHSARARLRLLFARRAAESRMNQEFQFHIEMETEQLMRVEGLAPDEARRRALARFGGVEAHKEAMRDGRGMAWLSGLSLDLRLGIRLLLKYPMLTIAGGLALAVAIAIGAGWYDMMGKVLSPTIPLPDGDRLVVIATQNIVTNEPEPSVVRDFLEWRRGLRTVEELGAYRTDSRNLIVDHAAPEPIEMAEITAAGFRAAHVSPLIGRGLLDADDTSGAPRVVVLGYDVWQRAFGGRNDVIGSNVKLGNTPATVIGVMPEAFAYPTRHNAWTPLSLHASYGALEGGAIDVIGRLAPGVTQAQADAELRVLVARAAAEHPATQASLRPRVLRIGELVGGIGAFTMTNVPVLLVLLIACTIVGTLIYARTATREGEIALRSALGASRARIVGQLFVEALVLASVAAAVGLIAADRILTWGIESVGKAPFWITPGLTFTTILYACGLAIASAALLSLLPALRATRARVQSHLANGGGGGATLRFGRVWTGAMIVQVALTGMGIPVAMETASEVIRKVTIRGAFPSREYLAARVDLNRLFEAEAASAFEARKARAFAALEQRVAQEPGVVAITYADRAPSSGASIRFAEIESSSSPSAGPAYSDQVQTSAVGPGFFELYDRPIVAGRAFHGGDWSPNARTVIVNEAFARGFSRTAGRGSPVGARLRYPTTNGQHDEQHAADWFEIVGVVRDFGLDPDDAGNEPQCVFHPASAGAVSSLVMSVRVRDNPAPLAARLPFIATDVDAGLFVRDAQPLHTWIRERDDGVIIQAGALAGVTLLVLCLSSLGIFSLVSVSVSRRTREIGLRIALGAHPRHVLAGILSRAARLMGSGILAGGALLMLSLVFGAGPAGHPAEDVPLFARYLAVTAAIMLVASLLACIGPARRALRINPTDALKDI